PVVLLNTRGFYDPLLAMFEHLYEEQFAWSAFRATYHVAPDAADALAHIDTYTPPDLPWKVMPKQA
ncbi:MAG: LOG family protein, partial [Anaerolineae bacterium]|nr:LOG family protein [Anaerolineae bacterium]